MHLWNARLTQTRAAGDRSMAPVGGTEKVNWPGPAVPAPLPLPLSPEVFGTKLFLIVDLPRRFAFRLWGVVCAAGAQTKLGARGVAQPDQATAAHLLCMAKGAAAQT